MSIILYVIGALYAVGSLGCAAMAAGVTHRGQRALMIAAALAAAGMAAVQILAAGEIR